MGLYDRVRANNSDYISQFVGSAVPEIQLTADTLQDRYDTNLASYDKLDFFANSLDAWDPEIKKAAIDSVRQTIDQVANNKGAWENADLTIRQKARELNSNEALRASIENKKAILAEEEMVAKMRAQGLNPLRFKTADNFKTIAEDGTIQRYQGDTQRELDYDKTKSTFFDQMQADAGDGKLTKADLADIPFYLQQNNWAGISKTKVGRYADEAYNRYITTPEYQQEKRKLIELEGVDPNQVDNVIKRSILSTGLERVFGQSGTKYIQDALGIAQAKAAAEEEAARQVATSQTEFASNPLAPPPLFDNIEYDDKGNIKGIKEKEASAQFQEPTGLLSALVTGVNNAINGDELGGQIDATLNVAKANIQRVRDSNPTTTAGMTDKQVAELYNDVRKNTQSVSVNKYIPSGDMTDVLTKKLFGTEGVGDIVGRGMYILDTQGKPKQAGEGQGVWEELGYDDSNIDEQEKAMKQARVTAIAGANPYTPGGYLATIKDADGKLRNVLIEADDAQKQFFRLSNTLGMAIKGDPIMVSPQDSGDGYQYESYPLINKDTKKYDIYVIRRDPNTGQVVPINGQQAVDLKTIQDINMERWRSSNYLGSQLTRTKNSSVE